MGVQSAPEGRLAVPVPRLAAPVAVLLLALLHASCGSLHRADARGPVRALWVARFHYADAGDVRQVMADAAAAGFERVLFQVRGNGTTYWPSALEIWSETHGHNQPGFDPLLLAVEEGHRRGLEVHAWVNVMPGWRGTEPPRDPRQLYNARPEWFLQTPDGEPQPLGSPYVHLDPTRPEVRRYVANLCAEIVRHAPVDGVHLDYVRLPTPDERGGLELHRDDAAVARFAAQVGGEPTAAALARWRRDSVTAAVAAIREAVRFERSVPISAAVFADPDVARDLACQDWPEWAARGLVDALYPMNYTADDERFATLTRRAVDLAGGVPVVIGIGLHKHPRPGRALEQMAVARACGAAGIAIFSYASMFSATAEATAAQRAHAAAVAHWNTQQLAR